MRVEIARNRNEAGGNNYLMRGTPGVGPFHPPTPIRMDGESRTRSANLQYVVPIVAYFNHPPPFLPSALPSPPTRINSSKSIVFDTCPDTFDSPVFPLFLERRTNHRCSRFFHFLFLLDRTLGRDEGRDRVRIRVYRDPIGYHATLDGMPPSPRGRGSASGDACSGLQRA